MTATANAPEHAALPAAPTVGAGDCTEPNRKDCPRLCIDFCNAAESDRRPWFLDALGAETRGHAFDFAGDTHVVSVPVAQAAIDERDARIAALLAEVAAQRMQLEFAKSDLARVIEERDEVFTERDEWKTEAIDAANVAADLLKRAELAEANLAGMADLLRELRTAIEPLTWAQIRRTGTRTDLADRIDAALSRAQGVDNA